MRCPSCNSRIENEAKICRYCGHDFGFKNPTHNELYDYSLKYSKSDNSDLTNNHEDQYTYSNKYSNIETYIDTYIGNNKKIVDSKFNIFAFLFGPFYLFYRNINTLGFISLIFYFIFIKEPFIIIFINILLGIEFKKYYYHNMNNNIDKIIKDNKDKSNDEIIELIKEKGNPKKGVNLLILIIGFIIMILIIFGMYNYTDSKKKERNNESVISFDRLEYKIPNKYKILSSIGNYKAYDSSNDEHNCIFSISVKDYKYYRDEASYIKIVDNTNNFSKVIINDNTWYYYKIDNRDIYVIKKDNYFYKVIFNTYRDKDKICVNSKKDIINSLDFDKER